jgi:AraC-like DNA-binding protein
VETIRGRLRVGITDPALLLAKSLKPAAMMITSEGVSRSVGEWARVYGLGDETIRGRLRAGIIDPALLFSRKRVETRKCRSITFEGVTRSLVEWSALLGIPLVTIYRRWNVGVTDPALLLSKEKLKTPWKGRKGKLLTWDGVMLSISEWAERVGCSDSSLRYRLRRYPVEVALQPNLLPKKGLEFEGVTLSVREWAGQLGCTAQALYMRLKKYPLEVALRSPFIRQPCCKKAAHQKKVTMDGVTLTIREWSEKLGCNPETLRTRLQTCLPEVALVRRFGLVTYDGLSLTIREWAERLGCNYTSLWSRLQRHPPEVALRKPFVKRLKKKKRKKNEEVGDSVF